jgi:23S rRNA (adenine2030-N6)-methyltransferase
MLSYQHGYHAGNVADVLKHTVLCCVIDYLLQKDKPLYFHDVHAGRGLYDLTHPIAQKTAEYREGIVPIWQAKAAPAAVRTYLDVLRQFNPNGSLRQYAGSLLLAERMLVEKLLAEKSLEKNLSRSGNRLFATELHPQEFAALQQHVQSLRDVRVSQAEGFAALKAALPPKEKRGVILLDPSYETLNDDIAVVEALREALQRFATGVYLVWYPIVVASRAEKLVKKIAALPTKKMLQVELLVREPSGEGMAGSGMLVINPPWILASAMQEALLWLVKQLAPDSGSYRVTVLRDA